MWLLTICLNIWRHFDLLTFIFCNLLILKLYRTVESLEILKKYWRLTSTLEHSDLRWIWPGCQHSKRLRGFQCAAKSGDYCFHLSQTYFWGLEYQWGWAWTSWGVLCDTWIQFDCVDTALLLVCHNTFCCVVGFVPALLHGAFFGTRVAPPV